MQQKEHYFPKDFLWGGSTASYQVEGGNVNQWSTWELVHAKELAKTAKKRLNWIPNWEKFEPAATDPNNYISAHGVDHYRRYKEDFKLAKSLNHNAFRFGIEWSRLEPDEGVWDKSQWDHYRDYIREMKEVGLEPMLNIWHWTMPVWFTKKGGFNKRANVKYFERFVVKLCQELDFSVIDHVITLNEPNVYASFGYMTGEWVPNIRSPWQFMKTYFNMTLAHKKAYNVIKASYPHVKIGIAQQMANIQAKRPHNLIDRFTTKWMRYSWNWWFNNRIRRYQDFVGINYYFTDYYYGFWRRNPKMPLSDLGWYMEPEGLYPLILRTWAHYKKPIYITENGLADADDKHRQWWLEATMLAMDRALSEGVDLKGYFHWSLLDNFEWKYGWWPQFGLVYVNRKTMKRTARPSALWWAERLKEIQRKA